MKTVTRRVTADGDAMNIDFGFIPDKVLAYQGLEETNADMYVWYKEIADAEGNGQYGIIMTGSTGVYTKAASAAGGLAAYDGGSAMGVRLPAPTGEGTTTTTFSVFEAGDDAPTARSTSVVGTVVFPSTPNGLCYECTATAGVLGTEPTWPTTPGTTVSDGTNTWICREADMVRVKKCGITIGADISTDSDEWILEASQFDRVTSIVDAATTDPI